MEKPKILYIDDDEAILISAKFMLSNICDLTTQQSPKKAVEQLKSGEKYDIIFLDLSIPEWDGLEVLKFLRTEYPSIPVFIVSGWTSGDARLQQAKALGANGFISKPFQRDEIKGTMDEVIKKK